jgi:CheY-like chemotaxis protein
VQNDELEPVLVIDDDAAICEALTPLLVEEGYRVVTAGNGSEALQRLRSGLRPCAILLDLMMPVMDGWDFRAEQMRDPEIADIPVIIVTAAGFTAKTVMAQLGAADFVNKPPPPKALLDAIRRHCRHDHPPQSVGG